MRLLDFIWRKMTVAVVKRDNIIQKHYLPSDDDYVRPVPIGRHFPGLDTVSVYMSENTPVSERESTRSRLVLQAGLDFKDRFNVTDTYTTTWTGTGVPYPPDFVALMAAPETPDDFLPGADRLAGIARRGPFSVYVKAGEDDGFEIDLRFLEGQIPRKPFIAAGGRARFARTSDGGLKTVGVDFGGRSVAPGDRDWALTEKRFLVGLNSYTTLINHLTYIHILGGGTFALCTHLAFSSRHPIRLLLQPFVVETMRVNNANIDGLIRSDNSNVPSYTGYYLAAINDLIRATVNSFDIRFLDAEYRFETQGQLDDPTFPTVESVVHLWRAVRRLADAWCARYLKTIDIETRIWCEEANDRIPNGVLKLLGIASFDDLEARHVAHLLTVAMFTASVWHHVVADMTRDYMMQFDVMPPALDENGNTTLGIVFEKRNSIAIAGLLRYKLLDDFECLPTAEMRQLWGSFQNELKSYEESLQKDSGRRRYCVVPSRVPSSIHA